VKGMLYGFKHADAHLNLFNLSCESTTTVTRIAEMVVEEMGLNNVTFKYTGEKRGWKGDVPRFQLDATRITRLGWKVSYSSDEAVRKAIRDVLDTKI
jgi:UDP-glucose 4-epimerase